MHVWGYIKDHSLQAGRIITPDEVLLKVCPVQSFDMQDLQGYVEGHFI